MRLVIISAAHKPYRGALMERSAARVGIEIVRYAEDQDWPNDFRQAKLVDGLECVKRLPQDVTHVMFLDSTDTLVLAGAEEIVQKYDRQVYGVLINGEKNCYPDKTLAPNYPQGRTAWHFVNSGGWIAHRFAAEKWMAYAAEEATFCDQLCWSKTYLKHAAIAVDEECRVFQSMYLQQPEEFSLSNGRLINHVTGEQPCVLHWNGTRNAGHLSRSGVWACLGIESREERKVRVA